jgi:hypothetical protein
MPVATTSKSGLNEKKTVAAKATVAANGARPPLQGKDTKRTGQQSRGALRNVELLPEVEPPGKRPTAAKAKAAASQEMAAGKAQGSKVASAKPPRKATQATTAAVTPVVKGTRKRAPKDLALQYGEKAGKRAPKKEPALARRKRMKAEERERLRQMMAPSDELMQRLARAGAITSTVVAMEDETEEAQAGQKKQPAVRRSRRWESRCGKCGTVGEFKSAAGLCARCGAIAVRL